MLVKKGDLEAGYVFAPYIIQTTTGTVSYQVVDHKSYIRKSKINKIFNKGFFVDSNKTFSPKKSIKSRYSKKIINANTYGYIPVVNNPFNSQPFRYYKSKNNTRKSKINKIFNR